MFQLHCQACSLENSQWDSKKAYSACSLRPALLSRQLQVCTIYSPCSSKPIYTAAECWTLARISGRPIRNIYLLTSLKHDLIKHLFYETYDEHRNEGRNTFHFFPEHHTMNFYTEMSPCSLPQISFSFSFFLTWRHSFTQNDRHCASKQTCRWERIWIN